MNYRHHDLRGNFSWKPSSTMPRRLGAEQIDQYDQQGYFILENVFSEQDLEPVTAELDRLEGENAQMLRDNFADGKLFINRADDITFTAQLVKQSPTLADFCRHPVFCDLVHDLIGPDVRLYWDQAVYKKPGNPDPFPWHQDNGYTFIEPQQYLTCWVPLVDATEENGCPRVVPGLHREGTLHHELTDLGFNCFDGEPEGAVTAPVKAGDIVVFSSLTPHATGPNLTDSVRKTYIVQFCPDGCVAVAIDDKGDRLEVPIGNPETQFHILSNGERTK